jgi:site-specific DNA-cytosine methylase
VSEDGVNGESLRELSLFTGVGGGLLGSMPLGWRTVCAVEQEADG